MRVCLPERKRGGRTACLVVVPGMRRKLGELRNLEVGYTAVYVECGTHYARFRNTKARQGDCILVYGWSTVRACLPGRWRGTANGMD